MYCEVRVKTWRHASWRHSVKLSFGTNSRLCPRDLPSVKTTISRTKNRRKRVEYLEWSALIKRYAIIRVLLYLRSWYIRCCVCACRIYTSRIELREVAPPSSPAKSSPFQEVRSRRIGTGIKFRLLRVYKVIFAREKVSGMRI